MANDVFRALAHPLRREIVERLSGGRSCFCRGRFEQHQRDNAFGAALVDVVSTERAVVDQRGESAVVSVHERP
jgi:hypothetical protein